MAAPNPVTVPKARMEHPGDSREVSLPQAGVGLEGLEDSWGGLEGL